MLKAVLMTIGLLIASASADYSTAKFAAAVDSFAPADIAWPD